MRQDQTIPGHVLEHALIAKFVVEDDAEVVILSSPIWTKGFDIFFVT